VYPSPVTLSVVIITHNEEANLARTLESVQPLVADGKGEIIVIDSGSTDRTVEIAKSFGAKVFVEEWKGYAGQKNSAIDKANGDWILSLDADEEVDSELQHALKDTLEGLERLLDLKRQADTISPRQACAHSLTVADVTSDVEYHIGAKFDANFSGFCIPRKNEFLGRWIRHGGFWPDPKLRFFRRGCGEFERRAVHEDLRVDGNTGRIRYGALIHHSYPTLSDYITHMNRYSSLGAEMVVAKANGKVRFSAINIVLRPLATFTYNYFFRLGFLDGREGLLLHLYHAVYVSWKYAKAWELSRQQ
jgi:glycosyltransferase involved in cell wall biosynthesis